MVKNALPAALHVSSSYLGTILYCVFTSPLYTIKIMAFFYFLPSNDHRSKGMFSTFFFFLTCVMLRDFDKTDSSNTAQPFGFWSCFVRYTNDDMEVHCWKSRYDSSISPIV